MKTTYTMREIDNLPDQNGEFYGFKYSELEVRDRGIIVFHDIQLVMPIPGAMSIRMMPVKVILHTTTGELKYKLENDHICHVGRIAILPRTAIIPDATGIENPTLEETVHDFGGKDKLVDYFIRNLPGSYCGEHEGGFITTYSEETIRRRGECTVSSNRFANFQYKEIKYPQSNSTVFFGIWRVDLHHCVFCKGVDQTVPHEIYCVVLCMDTGRMYYISETGLVVCTAHIEIVDRVGSKPDVETEAQIQDFKTRCENHEIEFKTDSLFLRQGFVPPVGNPGIKDGLSYVHEDSDAVQEKPAVQVRIKMPPMAPSAKLVKSAQRLHDTRKKLKKVRKELDDYRDTMVVAFRKVRAESIDLRKEVNKLTYRNKGLKINWDAATANYRQAQAKLELANDEVAALRSASGSQIQKLDTLNSRLSSAGDRIQELCAERNSLRQTISSQCATLAEQNDVIKSQDAFIKRVDPVGDTRESLERQLRSLSAANQSQCRTIEGLSDDLNAERGTHANSRQALRNFMNQHGLS